MHDKEKKKKKKIMTQGVNVVRPNDAYIHEKENNLEEIVKMSTLISLL